MTLQNIKLLRAILNDSLDKLEELYEAKSLDFPSLDKAYVADEADILTSNPEAIQAINLTVSAAYQLLSTVRHPFTTLADAASTHHLSACLRVAEKLNIVEILREAGPDGCHVELIAKQSGVEQSKLARVLRLLATHHIFREITPGTFANNRISSYFDTGKPSQAIFAAPETKYAETSGAAAYIGHFTDEVSKASSHLLETLEDPESGKKFLATQAALQKAFPTNKDLFAWLENPENQYRLKRHGACIRGTSLWDTSEAILQGFDWASLDAGSLVVDVGGGTGAPAMFLARKYSQLRILIQEREPLVIQGIQYWDKVFPEALSTGRVSFKVHDFFKPQPEKAASVFLVRTICHDWPDDLVMKILRHLRNAASDSTKLIIADFIIPHACPSNMSTHAIPGAETKDAPTPLLSNLGKATANAYWLDMTMQVLLNGQERTLSHHIEIAGQAGWRIVRVHRIDNSQFGYLLAEPIPEGK